MTGQSIGTTPQNPAELPEKEGNAESTRADPGSIAENEDGNTKTTKTKADRGANTGTGTGASPAGGTSTGAREGSQGGMQTERSPRPDAAPADAAPERGSLPSPGATENERSANAAPTGGKRP